MRLTAKVGLKIADKVRFVVTGNLYVVLVLTFVPFALQDQPAYVEKTAQRFAREGVTLRWVPFVVSARVELVHEVKSGLSCNTQPVTAGFQLNDRLAPEEPLRSSGTGIGVKFAASERAAARVKL